METSRSVIDSSGNDENESHRSEEERRRFRDLERRGTLSRAFSTIPEELGRSVPVRFHVRAGNGGTSTVRNRRIKGIGATVLFAAGAKPS